MKWFYFSCAVENIWAQFTDKTPVWVNESVINWGPLECFLPCFTSLFILVLWKNEESEVDPTWSQDDRQQLWSHDRSRVTSDVCSHIISSFKADLPSRLEEGKSFFILLFFFPFQTPELPGLTGRQRLTTTTGESVTLLPSFREEKREKASPWTRCVTSAHSDGGLWKCT